MAYRSQVYRLSIPSLCYQFTPSMLIKITSSQIHTYELSKPNRNPIIYLSVDFTPGL